MTARNLVVYVAGPFRGKDAWHQELNVRRAEELAWLVWQAGFTALCPHPMTRFYQHSLPDDVWLEGDLELLRRSDFILLVPGWENSTGTKAELEAAKEMGIPVVYGINQLKLYAERALKLRSEGMD